MGWHPRRRTAWIAAQNLVLFAVLALLAFGSTAGSSAVFGTLEGSVIVWAHGRAFNLFVGRWNVLGARERGIPAWATSPLLALAFLFGPCGNLARLALRAVPRAGAIDLASHARA